MGSHRPTLTPFFAATDEAPRPRTPVRLSLRGAPPPDGSTRAWFRSLIGDVRPPRTVSGRFAALPSELAGRHISPHGPRFQVFGWSRSATAPQRQDRRGQRRLQRSTIRRKKAAAGKGAPPRTAPRLGPTAPAVSRRGLPHRRRPCHNTSRRTSQACQLHQRWKQPSPHPDASFPHPLDPTEPEPTLTSPTPVSPTQHRRTLWQQTTPSRRDQPSAPDRFRGPLGPATASPTPARKFRRGDARHGPTNLPQSPHDPGSPRAPSRAK